MAEYDKLWVAQSIGTAALKRARAAMDSLGYALPCVVQAVSEPFVTVTLDVTDATLNGLQLVLPKVESPYFRAPTQVGDYGIALPVDAAIDHATGQSSTKGPIARQGNLANLVFVPVANKNSKPDDPNAAQVMGPTGARIRDTASTVVTRVGGGAIRTTGNVRATQNISAGAAVQGAVSTLTGSIVSFNDGIATELAGATATSFLNTQYFQNFVTEAQGVQNGDDLQALADQSMANVQGLTTACSTIQSALSGLPQLFTAPEANLTAIVSWITSFIPFLQQMYAAARNAASMAAALPAQTSAITDALNAAASRLGVTITIPPITT